jgi:alpha-N-arabinofuranosidase
VDSSAILGDGVLHVFLTNRNSSEAATVEICPAGMRLTAVQSAELVTGPSAQATNTFDQPDIVCSQPFTQIAVVDGKASTQLPPLSAAAISFRIS